MPTYLFVSHLDNNHDAAQESCFWTCSSTTRKGDQILVYVTQTGIQYEWRAESNAERIGYGDYECLVEYVQTFDPPITLAEIRRLVSRQEWKPPHLNFARYKSILVPQNLVKRLVSKRASHIAVKIDPRSALTFYNRGNAYADTFRYSAAIDFYNRALQRDPKFADAYNARGVAYADQGRHERAINDFNKALQFDPRFIQALSNRGLSYAEQGDYARSFADYARAIQLDPDDEFLYYNRGAIHHHRREYAKAIADHSEAIRRAPDAPLFYCARGAAYRHQGKFDLALADYRKATALDRKNALAYYDMAEIYAAQGNVNRAITSFRYSLSVELDEEQRRKIEQRLRNLGYNSSSSSVDAATEFLQSTETPEQEKTDASPSLQRVGMSRVERLVRIGPDFDVIVEGSGSTPPGPASQRGEWTQCLTCLVKLKTKNLARHQRRYHGPDRI